MKSRLILVLPVALTLSGCDVRASLYPVQGPLSKQTPLPVYAARIKGFNGPGRDVSVVFNEGEVLSGRWQVVPGARASKGAATAGAPATKNLSAEWDIVYGSGYYVARILGKSYDRAVVTGNRGSVLTVEIYTPETIKGEGIKGVAKDNRDNVFKLVFY
jgi:hypothetical protein